MTHEAAAAVDRATDSISRLTSIIEKLGRENNEWACWAQGLCGNRGWGPNDGPPEYRKAVEGLIGSRLDDLALRAEVERLRKVCAENATAARRIVLLAELGRLGELGRSGVE